MHCQMAFQFDACSRGCYDGYAGWSSLVARWAHNPKVGGSNPSPATNGHLWEKPRSDLFSWVYNRTALVSMFRFTVPLLFLFHVCGTVGNRFPKIASSRTLPASRTSS